jgi:hypothetical protein
MESDGRLKRAVTLKRDTLVDEIKMCEEDVADPSPQASKPHVGGAHRSKHHWETGK